MGFHVVADERGQWEEIEFALTPESIPTMVHLPGRGYWPLGCGNGRSPHTRFPRRRLRQLRGRRRACGSGLNRDVRDRFLLSPVTAERDPRSPPQDVSV